MKSRIAVPALPMSSTERGDPRPRSPTPSITTSPGAGPLHVDAEARHRAQRREAILALEEPVDLRGPRGNGAEHQRPVRDRLVARDPHPAGDARAGLDDELAHRQRIALGYEPSTRNSEAWPFSFASTSASGCVSTWPSRSMKNT